MSIKTNRPEINFRDTDIINRLLKDVERSNGERNDSYKKLTKMGVGYIWWLESEFGGNFDNETKFETDFKTKANISPKLTRTIFKNREITSLRLIDETIKKCLISSTTYIDNKQYVGMCSYLEFLENYNPALKFRTENDQQGIELSHTYGEFQYDEGTLSIIHGLFNADTKIWEFISITDFHNNFKETPVKTLEIKNEEGFCYLMSKYENSKIGIKNINEWFKLHFDISNYSKSKKKKKEEAKSTENKKLQQYIDDKLK